MLRYTKDQKWELIHEAYGIVLKGKYDLYDRYDGRVTKVITDISVNGRECYLGGRDFIEAEKQPGIINMEDDKDLLCYYFATCEEKDDWEFERFWEKEYHGCLWRSHTQERMLRARLAEEEKQKQAERDRIRNEELAKIKARADKKKLRMITEFDTVYLVKIDKRKHKNSDEASDELVLRFAREYPGNGIEIVETMEVA